MADFFETLHRLYEENNLVPLIGAGFSKPFGLPEWDELLRNILQDADMEAGYRSACELDLNKRYFFKVINSLKDNANMSEDDIKLAVAKCIKKKRSTIDFSNIDNNYIDIAEFGFNIILTTNYDELVYRYLKQSEYNLPLLLSDFKYPQALDTDKYVFHMHGMVTAPDSIILSEKSYNNLYKKKFYTDLFKFIGMGKSLLFLGNSVTDQYINDILKVMYNNYNTKHYAIFHESTDINHRERLKKDYNVESYVYEADSDKEHVLEIRKLLYRIRKGKKLVNVTTRIENGRNNGEDFKFNDTIFIGRKNEINLFNNLIYERLNQKNAICFYGDKGVGKTSIMKQIEQDMLSSEYECFYCSMMKSKNISFAEFLVFNIDKSQRVIIDENISIEQFVKEHNNIVILIDEFQGTDTTICSAFFKVLKLIREKRRKIYFVVNCAETITDPDDLLEQEEVIPFTMEETKTFLFKYPLFNVSLNNIDIAKERIKEFYSLSMGKPQLFNLILGSESIQSLLEIEAKSIDDVVNNILLKAKGTLDKEVIEALKLLSLVSEYEVEWKSDLPGTILGAVWDKQIKEKLLNKSLLISMNDTYKLHDYVSGFFLKQINASEQKMFYYKLTEYYLSSDNIQKYFFGLAYSVEFFERTKSVVLLDKYFDLTFSKMREKGQLKSLRNLLRRLFTFPEREKLICEPLNFKIQYAYAIVKQELGETSEAVKVFEKLLNQSDLDSNKYYKLLLMLADGYRLTGKIGACFEKIQMSIDFCKKKIKEHELYEQDLIKAKIEHAHCLYLLGKFVESKYAFDKIGYDYPNLKEYCELYVEYSYRYSKTLRSLGQLDTAMNKAKDALYFACDEKYRGLAYWSLCIIEVSLFSRNIRETLDEAIVYYKKAKSIFEKIGYRATVFIDYDMAEIYKLDGEFDQAIEIYSSLIKITHDMNETNREAFALLGLAETIRWQKQYNNPDAVARDTIEHYEKAKKLFSVMDLEYGMMLCSLGEMLASQNYITNQSHLQDLLDLTNINYPKEREIVENVVKNQKPLGFSLNII